MRRKITNLICSFLFYPPKREEGLNCFSLAFGKSKFRAGFSFSNKEVDAYERWNPVLIDISGSLRALYRQRWKSMWACNKIVYTKWYFFPPDLCFCFNFVCWPLIGQYRSPVGCLPQTVKNKERSREANYLLFSVSRSVLHVSLIFLLKMKIHLVQKPSKEELNV